MNSLEEKITRKRSTAINIRSSTKGSLGPFGHRGTRSRVRDMILYS
jgi:hypothetical protein